MWNQAICDTCFGKREPGREPVRITPPEREVCCDCGADTDSGIYIRAHRDTVRFPTQER